MHFIKVRSKVLFCWFIVVVFTCYFTFNLWITPEGKLTLVYDKNIKYILQWTKPDTIPFVYMEYGQKVFQKQNCIYQNCFVTPNRSSLQLEDFDAILFHGPEVRNTRMWLLPQKRYGHQKYVFVSIESSHYYPVCHSRFDGYFNWTWTYRLDFYIPYPYLTIRDKTAEIIGPRESMHWMSLEEMAPIDEALKIKLKTKTKAAAWIVSNCNAISGREKFVKALQTELNKFDLVIDIYGGCGNLKCPVTNPGLCVEAVQKDYYFYLSFENSFSEYYVTEKLLTALNNYAVPIVYGGANYTRFMPDGVYVNAKELGPKKLAEQMHEIINNKEMYYNFFKWHNHYSYHAPNEYPDSDDHCKLCEMLNQPELKTESTVLNFQKWWSPPGVC